MSTSYRANDSPNGLRTASTRPSAIWCARMSDVIAAMPSAASSQPCSTQRRCASAIGSGSWPWFAMPAGYLATDPVSGQTH